MTSASTDARRETPKDLALGVDCAGALPTYTAEPSSPTKLQHGIWTLSLPSTTRLPSPTAPATGTTTAMARPSGTCPPSLSRRPSTPLRNQPRRVRYPWLPQPRSPRHLLPPDYRRQTGASPSLRLDQ